MKSRSLAALSVSVVFAISGIPAYAGEAEADPFGKYEEALDVHFVRATDDTIETYALGYGNTDGTVSRGRFDCRYIGCI